MHNVVPLQACTNAKAGNGQGKDLRTGNKYCSFTEYSLARPFLDCSTHKPSHCKDGSNKNKNNTHQLPTIYDKAEAVPTPLRVSSSVHKTPTAIPGSGRGY